MPNNSARNLKRNDAKAIAVLVKGIGNTFFSELVGILERECEKKRYSCILQYVDEQEDEWDVAIRVGKEKKAARSGISGRKFLTEPGKDQPDGDSLCAQYHLYGGDAGSVPGFRVGG